MSRRTEIRVEELSYDWKDKAIHGKIKLRLFFQFILLTLAPVVAEGTVGRTNLWSEERIYG